MVRDAARADDASLVRQYARIVGIVVIVIGIVGLIAGERQLAGLINVDIVEDIVHIVTGGLLAWAGFALRDLRMVRNIVGGLGVVYVLVGILGFIDQELFGLLPHRYTVFDNLLHLVLGALNIVVAWVVGRERAATARA